MKTQTGRLDCSRIAVNADGNFDILRPEKPAGYRRFIATLKVVDKAPTADPAAGPEHMPAISAAASCSMTGSTRWPSTRSPNWVPSYHPPPTRRSRGPQICQFGETVRNQMHFWNAFWTIPMEVMANELTIPGVAFRRTPLTR